MKITLTGLNAFALDYPQKTVKEDFKVEPTDPSKKSGDPEYKKAMKELYDWIIESEKDLVKANVDSQTPSQPVASFGFVFNKVFEMIKGADDQSGEYVKALKDVIAWHARHDEEQYSSNIKDYLKSLMKNN
jgi:5-methylcytosine-specific restriction endonuclease McrBC regulatory subunit McrC